MVLVVSEVIRSTVPHHMYHSAALEACKMEGVFLKNVIKQLRKHLRYAPELGWGSWETHEMR
jgi:hypothetical protein